MKVLHVLYQSLPNTAGSSIRSRDIVMSQLAEGITPIVVTSPFQKPLLKNTNFDIIEGVKHYRTYSGIESEVYSEERTSLIQQIRKGIRIFSFTRKVYKIAQQEDVDLLHAHAMFFCAISAKIASILLRKRMVYEVRSLWEERFKNTNLLVRIRFGLLTFLETFSMFISDEIIAINKGLQQQLLDRNLLRKKKIHIVPNAVNLDRIKIKSLQRPFNKDDIVFGYIGSISKIEGLNHLIDVFHRLKQKGYRNKLLIFGDGIMRSKWEELSSGNELIEFKGWLPQSQIYSAYNQIDIIVNPRNKNYLTDSVTPLKPLEAMGYQKVVMASNIGGMREIIEHNKTGILFEPDSVTDLEEAILSVFKRNDLDKIIQNAKDYVLNNKNWRLNAKRYIEIYNGLL